MQVYTELAAPTAVTHSLSLPLTSATTHNLVVAKGSLLQIFATKTISAELDAEFPPRAAQKPEPQFDFQVNHDDDDGLETSFLGGEAMLMRTDRANNTKLVLVAEAQLAGTVIGLARLKIKTLSGGEALLLAYKAAKMCLAEWDPKKNALETMSLHYYEKDELRGAPWELGFGDYVNYLEADPGSRCAAFKFGTRNLAILPFKRFEEGLELDDWDEDLDGPRPVKEEKEERPKEEEEEPVEAVNGGGGDDDKADTAYTPSFVLRLPLLDSSLLHPIHLTFLHEYREPTFGILYSTQASSLSLGLKDHVSYKVFTLDLQQQASTTILSVTNLPQDLYKVIALPAPVGGALLAGQNELIHIDQSGKPNGVAVNPMAKQTTSFSLTDQSDLNLRLEGCAIEMLAIELGELLLVLNNGRLAIISFKIDGRTVSGIGVKLVGTDCDGDIVKSRPSCISRLGKNAFFLGSETGDSVVLGWSRRLTQEKRKKSRLMNADLALEELDLDNDDDEDDDLYGNDSAPSKLAQGAGAATKSGEVCFRIHDALLSIAPIRDMTCGKPSFLPDSEEAKLGRGVSSELQLVCVVGRGEAGSLAVINREVQPRVIGRFDFPEARGFWTMCVKKPFPKSLGASAEVAGDYDAPERYDKFMIVAKVDLDGYETSDVYALTAAGFETLKETEFEPAAGFTVEAGMMGRQMRVIQVLKSEVRCYDGDLSLMQILPMLDEETGAEPRATSASIMDPYLLIVRDDNSVFVAQIDGNNEIEEVEKADSGLCSTKWLAGCLYRDDKGVFQTLAVDRGTIQTSAGDKGTSNGENIFLFLLSLLGALHIYALPDLSKAVYVAQGLSSVPPHLSAGFVARRGAVRETLVEILVADLGDAVSQSPYLILRHSTDDLTIYEPIRQQEDGGGSTLSDTLFFKKTANATLAKSAEEAPREEASQHPRFAPMRTCAKMGGYSAVFLPGASASFVLKSSKSMPRVVGLQGLGVRGMSPFHTEGCDRGFIYADSQGIARVSQLPSQTNLAELGLSVKKVPLGCEVQHVAYHDATETYVAACAIPDAFELPRDDDYHKEWARENLLLAPSMPRGVLKLISPATWTVVHAVELEPCETIESMKTLHLEVSEETRERRMLLAVGTALSKGEDLPTRGRVAVYDIVTVIPEPGRPETNKRLKLLAREEIPRGGVTALSEVGTQGLMLVAQGQKCMVRGLKEDGSLLPVAFLDMSCHVSAVRELPGTGLCLMADAFKGLWFAGYTEEPYTFKVLGKSGGKLPLLVADFLPDGEDLSMVAADADGDLHILEFNPGHPKSLQGHLLLHRTTFSVTPNHVTSTLLLPRVIGNNSNGINGNGVNGNSSSNKAHILLLASPSGCLAALTPVQESTYRRLLSVTNQLIPALMPQGGLNARSNRLTEGGMRTVGVETAASGRAIVDGAVLAKWNELGAGKRAEVAARGGYDGVMEMRDDLEGVLGWSGLAYV